MTILSITTDVAGQVDVNPRRVKIISTDDLTTVTTAGYLDSVSSNGFKIMTTDVIDMIYDFDEGTQVGTYAVFLPTISAGMITLALDVDEGNVLLPVTDKYIAIFNGTSGQIQSGQDAAQPLTVITPGSIQLGRSGVAGKLVSYPTTTAKGTFQFVAAPSAGDTDTKVTNASMAQATTFTLPDPTAATATINVIDASLTATHFLEAKTSTGVLTDGGFSLRTGTTDTWGGGSATHDFTATGLLAGSRVFPSISACTTADVAIVTYAVLGANSLRVIFTKDPGAGTIITWFATKV